MTERSPINNLDGYDFLTKPYHNTLRRICNVLSGTFGGRKLEAGDTLLGLPASNSAYFEGIALSDYLPPV